MAAPFSAQERRDMARKGVARPDGSYPIRNQNDLDDAVKDYIRTGRPMAVKEWIRKRAAALNLELPESMEAKGQPDEVEMAKAKTAA